MQQLDDTICAISTAPGTGGIAVIRVSGPKAVDIVNRLWSGADLTKVTTHTTHLGTIRTSSDTGSQPLDQAVATVFLAPKSFTGDDVVELSVHGSPYVQTTLIDVLCRNGARIAEPGEFTRRAFVAGKLDLAEAEAVADLISSTSGTAHRLAISQLRGNLSRKLDTMRDNLLQLASLLELELDFSEEDVEFADRKALVDIADDTLRVLAQLQTTYVDSSRLRNGLPVVLVGAPNVGKSSLLNSLTDTDRAIVSEIPGTTRDTLDITLDLQGTPFRLIDTAGLRDTDDPIEIIGIERTNQAAAQAHVLLMLNDSTTAPDADIIRQQTNRLRQLIPEDARLIAVLTKSDISTPSNLGKWTETLDNIGIDTVIPTSSHPAYKDTLESLKEALIATLPDAITTGEAILTNIRHLHQVENAIDALTATRNSLQTNLSGDLVAQDLRAAIHHLSEITGHISSVDILHTIFSRFCIGK